MSTCVLRWRLGVLWNTASYLHPLVCTRASPWRYRVATSIPTPYNGPSFLLSQRLLDPPYDVVVFNFPHVGAGEKDRKRNIALNRALITGFSCSAVSMIHEDGGEIHITGKKRSCLSTTSTPR